MTSIPFIKMHGLGNDFVIFNSGDLPEGKTYLNIAKLADRRRGIGCDQVILLAPSDKADIAMRIFNADGGEAGACGNASRCVGWLMLRERKARRVTLETPAEVLVCEKTKGGVRVNMGRPRFGWRDIPLAEEQDTLHLRLEMGPLRDPAAVSMGNPHAVFFVDDIEAADLAALGPALERHSLFPERANIGVAQVEGKDSIRLRVWERGAGETLACGTAACAALAAAHRRGLTGRGAIVHLPGGDLRIDWQGEGDGGELWMTGPVAVSFHGTFEAGDYGR